MPRSIPLLLLLLLLLTGCSQDLHFQIHFQDADGLKAGDPVVVDHQAIGTVTSIETDPNGGQLVNVAVSRTHAGATTVDSKFYLSADPGDVSRKRIEIVQRQPGGKMLKEGALVQGSTTAPFGFPLGDILKEFGSTLRGLSDQVERFRQDFERLPDSEEGRRLQQEWRRLIEQIREAQSQAEDSVKKEWLPKLQQELETLKKKLEEMQKAVPKQEKPLET